MHPLEKVFDDVNRAVKSPKTLNEYELAIRFFNIERFKSKCETCSRKKKCNLLELNVYKCNFYRKKEM